MKRKALFVMVGMVVLGCMMMAQTGGTEVVNQSSKEKKVEFKEYEVGEGETLSEIAWVLNISMKKLTDWNPEVLNQGVRNLQSGTVIKYKTSKQISEQVADSQEEIRRDIRNLKRDLSDKEDKTREKYNEEAQKTRARLEKEEEETREDISRESDEVKKLFSSKFISLQEELEEATSQAVRVESRVKAAEQNIIESIKNGRSSWEPILLILIFVGILLLLAFSALHLDSLFGRKAESKEASAGAPSKPEPKRPEFNQRKLEELSGIDLSPKDDQEEEIEFDLHGHHFKILVSKGSDGYSSWQQDSSGEFKKFSDKESVRKSIKQSLKNYLSDREGAENKIKEAIEKKKIAKTN